MKKILMPLIFLSFFIGFSTEVVAQANVRINRPVRTDQLKSASKAKNLALVNTIVPLVTGVGAEAIFNGKALRTTGAFLAVYGILVGPSTGNFYALDYPRGVVGLGARALGAYLMADATSEIFGRSFANALHVDDRDVSLTDTKTLIGGALILGSFFYNVLSTNASVKEFNGGSKRFSMQVTPSVIEDKVAPLLTAQFKL